MSSIRTAVRSWWSLAIVATAIAIAAIAPSSASAAIYNPSAPDGAYGYQQCQYSGTCGGYYGAGAIAPANYQGYATIMPAGQIVFGFRWTGYGWQRYQIAQGRYYVTPYSGKWRWVLTSYGWLIVGNGTVIAG